MRLPPDSVSMRIERAPASRAFSSNSFTTEAGLSTTSPAAILFATASANMRMRDMNYLNVLNFNSHRSWKPLSDCDSQVIELLLVHFAGGFRHQVHSRRGLAEGNYLANGF